MAGLRLLLPMLHPRGDPRQRTVRGQSNWLSFLCRTLSFPILSRFIPALSLSLFLVEEFPSVGHNFARHQVHGESAIDFDRPVFRMANRRMANTSFPAPDDGILANRYPVNRFHLFKPTDDFLIILLASEYQLSFSPISSDTLLHSGV
jgi:hypothetical protein